LATLHGYVWHTNRPQSSHPWNHEKNGKAKFENRSIWHKYLQKIFT
jgi:hypothetical protein